MKGLKNSEEAEDARVKKIYEIWEGYGHEKDTFILTEDLTKGTCIICNDLISTNPASIHKHADCMSHKVLCALSENDKEKVHQYEQDVITTCAAEEGSFRFVVLDKKEKNKLGYTCICTNHKVPLLFKSYVTFKSHLGGQKVHLDWVPPEENKRENNNKRPRAEEEEGEDIMDMLIREKESDPEFKKRLTDDVMDDEEIRALLNDPEVQAQIEQEAKARKKSKLLMQMKKFTNKKSD